MSRVTINDIARRSGVSKSAVSYALNGRPGVSEPTRRRILEVAERLGWSPDRTARLLSGSRTDSFGLVLGRDPKTLAIEPFYMEFMAGIESVLSTRSYALLLQVCATMDDELAAYRRWSSERRVDAVVVVDLRTDDPRVPLLRELGLPAVFVGNQAMPDDLTSVWTDDTSAMHEAVGRLVSLGHTRLARVSGLGSLSHVHLRDQAFEDALRARGLQGRIVRADFSGEGGRAATRELVLGAEPPTAILFDNDLMAISSLSALAEAGIAVPEQISLLAWDDSALCEITHPKLSAMSRDVVALGAHVGRRVFAVIEGAPPGAHYDSSPVFSQRGSIGPPPLR